MSVTVSLVTFQPFLIVFAYFKSYHIYSHNIVDTPPCFLANGYNIWIRWRLGRNTCQETTILFHEILRMRQHSPGGRMKMTHSHYQEAPLSFNKTVKTSRWSADSHSRLPPPFFLICSMLPCLQHRIEIILSIYYSKKEAQEVLCYRPSIWFQVRPMIEGCLVFQKIFWRGI